MRAVAGALSRALGIPGRLRSVRAEEFGPIGEAFALEQQIRSQRATKELGWQPAHHDALADLAAGRRRGHASVHEDRLGRLVQRSRHTRGARARGRRYAGVVRSRSSRFCCPACGAALTPWLRELTLGEALAIRESRTWLLPGGTFAHRYGPLLRDSQAGPPMADYPWLLPPLGERWLRAHPDRGRWQGCCGMSYCVGQPNLVCPCGQEVGFGYRDCCNPHWYALHEAVVVEVADEPEPQPPWRERLARARARVDASLPEMTRWVPRGSGVYHGDASTWDEALRLVDVRLACGGGAAEPALMLASAQLPAGSALVLPIPWSQLARLLVLDEQPWGSPDVPLTWQRMGESVPHVQVSQRGRTVLVTSWRGTESGAVRIDTGRWIRAWARLRR